MNYKLNMKLDLKDIKILGKLSVDSRQPLSTLASQLGLSKNAVSYKVEKLKKEGVIRKFTPYVNLGKFGCNSYDLFIKLNIRPEEYPAIISKLKTHQHIIWMITLSGEWDLMIEFAAKMDDEHIAKVIDEILKIIGSSLEKYELHIAKKIIKVESLPKDFFKEKEQAIQIKEQHIESIDQIDKKILVELCKNGEISTNELSQITNVSQDTVRLRIKKLYQGKVIRHFGIDINHSQIGYKEYLIYIEFRSNSEKEIKGLEQFIKANDNVIYTFFGLTKLELITYILVKDPLELDKIMREIKNKYFPIINTIHSALVTEVHLLNLFPEGCTK